MLRKIERLRLKEELRQSRLEKSRGQKEENVKGLKEKKLAFYLRESQSERESKRSKQLVPAVKKSK